MKYIYNLLLVLITSYAYSQDRVEIQRLNSKITLDGIIDEQAWDQIKPLPLIQHKPIYGNQPTERSEVKLAYDDNFLYLAGKLFDTEKASATTLERDGGNTSSDWFGLIIDSYNDKENGTAFFTTPTGTRWDASILDGGVGSISYNTNWNSFWDVATSVTGEGWFAEFRIPLSSLRFQSVNEETVMGLITYRILAKNNEIDIFPDISPKYGPSSFIKVSQAREIVLKNIKSKNPVYLTPYLLGGVNRNFYHNMEKTKLVSENKYKPEAGLDLKYGITSNLTLDATINPDFAQVEEDNQEINLSRYSLFFPEKRKFFQERSSSFEMNFTENNKVFYSRKIGIDGGDQVRIYGGVRLVGRTKGWDIGILNMQTEETNNLPTENLGVLRLRRQILNSNSNIGIVATTRLGNNGNYNVVYGVDGTIKVFGNEYFRFALAQSVENDLSNKPLSIDPARIYLYWERRIQNGFSYLIEGSHVGQDYNPGLGFENRENYKSLNAKLKYSWFPKAESKVYQHQTFVRSLTVFNNETGIVESSQVEAKWDIASKLGYSFKLAPRWNYENVNDTIFLDDNTFIPNNNYDFSELILSFNTPASYPVMMGTEFAYGPFYDGTKFSSSLKGRWSVSKHLYLESTYKFNNVSFPTRKQYFLNHIMRLRALVMLNTKISLSSFIQYNSANNNISSNIRFKYNPSEGHDLYVVYNQSSLVDESPIGQINPNNKFSAIMIKYNYTLKL